MSDNAMELQIAASAIRPNIPKDKPLGERVSFAMRYAIEHESAVFWMSPRATDDMKLRTALAAVMLEGSEEDRDLITRSLKPMQMLSAAISGIPVDFSQMDLSEDLLPLMKMFHEAKEPTKP